MKKIFIFGIIGILLFGVYSLITYGKAEQRGIIEYIESPYINKLENVNSYSDYKKTYNNISFDTQIEILATDNPTYSEGLFDDDISLKTIDGIEGLYIPETGEVSWKVDVPHEGYYNIKILYYPIEGRSAAISKGIKLNGEYPFKEAQDIILTRVWADEFDVSKKREPKKHDSKPRQIEDASWREEIIKDHKGYHGDSYEFYFNEGENTFTLVSNREPAVIEKIILFTEEPLKSYEKIKQFYLDNNYQEKGYADIVDKVQGENSFQKSSPTLAPVADYSSYKVEPYTRFITRYNTIGGYNWRVPGDWISWEVDIPESGLYYITFKALQNYDRGMNSSRTLYINDSIPFLEAKNIEFKYKSDWQNVTLGNDDEKYLFYFEKGINTIKLEATIGSYGAVVNNIEEVISNLNMLYRKVVMTTGINPDAYQDYLLSQRIPNLHSTIDECVELLENSIDMIIEIAGARSSTISSLNRTLYQLKRFQKSERNIQLSLREFEQNISALGTWVMTISEQPLSIDYLVVHGSDVKLPKASTNFFQKVWHELVMLFGSYGANTSLQSSVAADGPTIEVWISTGRDQATLIRQLIDESFTIQNNVNVNLKLVNGSVLLPATLSKNGPDIAIGVGEGIPVNWGIRNAVYDLSSFSDFEEFSKNFHPSALVPYTFRDKVYALPDTQEFLMTFYRKDVMEELSIENTPKTWDEVIDILPVLQRQYLEFYLPNVQGALNPLLYSMINQYGGKLYEEDGIASALTTPESTKAFLDFTDFFANKGFAMSANFVNRFRTGEMPIGIAYFTMYNTLSVFAPEINGQWEFAPLPGIYQEDGKFSNVSSSTTSATILLEQSTEKNASWKFIKWWLGTETQVQYARGMEAILGAAARYPTANINAFAQLPWPTKDYITLKNQRDNAVGVPVVPGDYIVGRYIDNAFRAVINKDINPRESLFDYHNKINIELTRKRKEFGLD